MPTPQAEVVRELALESNETDYSAKNFSLMFVHVGKTGGTSLDVVLRSNCEWYRIQRRRRLCLQKLLPRESRLSAVTKVTTHTDLRREFDDWLPQIAGFFFTARNPLSRVVSAFNFGHPRNTMANDSDVLSGHQKLFYFVCFPTVEDLALRLWDRTDPRCYDLGVKTLRGKGYTFVASHLKHNYEFYARRTIWLHPDRLVFVARTEHLWEDLADLDVFLGGDGVFPQSGHAMTHGSEEKRIRSGLSLQGTAALCCFIVTELSIYEILIRKAVNLTPRQKQETLEPLYRECNAEVAWNATHPFSWVKWRLDPARSACPAR